MDFLRPIQNSAKYLQVGILRHKTLFSPLGKVHGYPRVRACSCNGDHLPDTEKGVVYLFAWEQCFVSFGWIGLIVKLAYGDSMITAGFSCWEACGQPGEGKCRFFMNLNIFGGKLREEPGRGTVIISSE